MASTLPRLPIFEHIARHDPQATAVVHSLSARSFTYGNLIRDVADTRRKLQERANGKSLAGERIAFLIENSYDYVGAQPLRVLDFTACRVERVVETDTEQSLF